MEHQEEGHAQDVERLKSAHGQEVERLQTELVAGREGLRMELAQMHMGKFSAMATELSNAHKVCTPATNYIIDNEEWGGGGGHPHKSCCYRRPNYKESNRIDYLMSCLHSLLIDFFHHCCVYHFNFQKSTIFISLSILNQHFYNIKP